jgi:hypothetical protein
MAFKAQTPFRRAFALLGLAALLMVPASPALAQAKTFTTTASGTETSPAAVNPCTGDPGAFTITYTGVFHITQNAAGGTRTTGTLTGTFVYDTTDPTRADFTGRFTQTFGDNTNRNNQLAISTFTVRGTGTDGSTVRFHTMAHITAETIDVSTDPPTVTGVKVNFDTLRCG